MTIEKKPAIENWCSWPLISWRGCRDLVHLKFIISSVRSDSYGNTVETHNEIAEERKKESTFAEISFTRDRHKKQVNGLQQNLLPKVGKLTLPSLAAILQLCLDTTKSGPLLGNFHAHWKTSELCRRHLKHSTGLLSSLDVSAFRCRQLCTHYR